MGTPAQRCEILDWHHLVEHLGRVGGSLKRLNQVQSWLWQGKVDETLALFDPLAKKAARDFCVYLRNHRARIVNYPIIKQKASRLAQERLNRPSSKSDVGLKFQGLSGRGEMFHRF